MSIDYLDNTGAVDGFGQHQGEQYSNEDLEAEIVILQYLDDRHNLNASQARAVIASLQRASVNLHDLAHGLINDDESAVAQLKVFLC